MVALPVLQASTVTGIYAGWERDRKEFDTIGISISALGSDCDRAIWYDFRWGSAPEVMTGQKLRRFETGNIEETRLLNDLRRISKDVEVIDVNPETGRQFKVYSVGGHVRGKLDGLVTGIPEAPKTQHVVEAKSHNDKSYKELVKKGLKVAKPGHYRQCLYYLGETGLTRCLYLAVNKNTDEVYSERVEFDPVAFMVLKARLERIIESARAPSRIAEDPAKWPCIMCKHKDVCFSDKFGRNHCRTCISSTPVVVEGSNDATWTCNRHGKTLTVDEQRAGCGSHLYIPDVVPGEQQDAGDDFVAYIMRDGSEWRDTFHPPKPHVLDKCEPNCGGCHYCLGGLALCTVCGGAEASLPTDCPGVRMGEDRAAEVQAGRLDFVRGEWINKYEVEK